MFVIPGDIPRGHDQDTFGRLRLIAPGRSPRLQVLKKRLHISERPLLPRVISIPSLCNTGVGLPQLLD